MVHFPADFPLYQESWRDSPSHKQDTEKELVS